MITALIVLLIAAVIGLALWSCYLHCSLLDAEDGVRAMGRRVDEVRGLSIHSTAIDKIHKELGVQKNRNGRLRARIRKLEGEVKP